MKLFKYLCGLILFFFTCSVSPTIVNGRFQVIEIDASKIAVQFHINTNTGNEDLGGTTLVISFDTNAVSFTDTPVKGVDYIFHNFDGGNYSTATVTKPIKNQIWVNIDLPYLNNNNGTIVEGSPGWTEVVTIHFDILDANRSANLIWLTSSPFWGVYDGDNSTLWQNGQFEDYPTSVEPASEIPINFELSQNYPNPFNPSTKIKFTIPNIQSSNLVPVKLKVYDVLGDEVATLIDEEKAPGLYEIEFSTSSGSLSTLSSGVYLYTIIAGDFVQTKKMILLK